MMETATVIGAISHAPLPWADPLAGVIAGGSLSLGLWLSFAACIGMLLGRLHRGMPIPDVPVEAESESDARFDDAA